MMLCDFAEAVGGKLYIAGGGWSYLRGAMPLDCAIAVSIAVPWNATNQQHKLELDLLDEDGNTVIGPDGNPVHVDGEFEVGRPPGTKAGDPISNSLSFRIQGVPLPTGGYSFVIRIDGNEMGKTPFRVLRPDDYQP